MPSNKHQSAIESNSAFMVKMEDLVKEIIIQNNIPYYRIESTMDHQQDASGEHSYEPIVRVVTYFEDTVNKIAAILGSEFDIERTETAGQNRGRLDSFSYKHIEFSAALKAARQELVEYRRAGAKAFKIQVCSMLQDAWAGIERELGYDNGVFPEEIKRDFYRVGALLEMADMEFLKIRSELTTKYAATAQKMEEPAKAAVAEIAATPVATVQEETVNEPIVVAEEPQQPVAEQETNNEAAAYAPAPQEYIIGYHANGMPIYAPQAYYPNPYQPYGQPFMNAGNGYMPQPIFQNGVFQGYMPPQFPFPGQPQAFMPGQPFIPGQPFTPGQPFVPGNGLSSNGHHAPSGPMPANGQAAGTEHKPATTQETAAAEPKVASDKNEPVAVAEVTEVIPATEIESEAKADEPTAAQTSEPANADAMNETAQAETEETSSEADGAIPEISNETEGQKSGISLDTIDMNVDKPNTLALNVKNIEETNGVAEGGLPDIINGLPANLSVGAMGETEEPAEQKPATGSEQVSLNIDNVETFNMNVNGMIERHTEIIIDKNAKDESIPFYDREPIPIKPNVLDENAPMTDAMLKEYVNNSKLVKEVDAEVALRAGASLNSDVDVDGDVERLKFLKVFTLKQLHERILDNKEDIIAFAEKWIGSDNGGSFDSGICLFYLEYLLVGKRNDPAFAVEYVLKFISDNDYSARFIIPTYNSISKNDKPIGAHLTLK